MYNGIGLQTARGSGTNGYIQTNKFFIKPRTNTAAAPAPYDLDAAGSVGGVKKANKDILEHDRKRRIEIRLLTLQEALAEQGYTEEEIVERVAEARKGLEEEAKVKAKEGDRAAMPAPSKRFSDTQSHQIAARKQKQLELFRNALGIKQVVEPLNGDQDEENQQKETLSLENEGSDEEKAPEGKVSKDIIQINETHDLMEEGEIRSSKKSLKEGFKHQKYSKDDKDDTDSDGYPGKQNTTKGVDKSVKKLKRQDSDSDSDSDRNLGGKKKLVGKQPTNSRRYDSDDSKAVNYDDRSSRRGLTDRHHNPPNSHKTTANEIGSGMKSAIKYGRYEKSSTNHDSEDSLSDTDREKENRGKVTKKHNNSVRRHDSKDSDTEIDEGKKNKRTIMEKQKKSSRRHDSEESLSEADDEKNNKRKIMEKQKKPSRRHDSEDSLSEADDEKNNKRKIIDTRSKPRRRYDSEDSLSESDKRTGRKTARDIIQSKIHDKASRRHDSQISQLDNDYEKKSRSKVLEKLSESGSRMKESHTSKEKKFILDDKNHEKNTRDVSAANESHATRTRKSFNEKPEIDLRKKRHETDDEGSEPDSGDERRRRGGELENRRPTSMTKTDSEIIGGKKDIVNAEKYEHSSRRGGTAYESHGARPRKFAKETEIDRRKQRRYHSDDESSKSDIDDQKKNGGKLLEKPGKSCSRHRIESNTIHEKKQVHDKGSNGASAAYESRGARSGKLVNESSKIYTKKKRLDDTDDESSQSDGGRKNTVVTKQNDHKKKVNPVSSSSSSDYSSATNSSDSSQSDASSDYSREKYGIKRTGRDYASRTDISKAKQEQVVISRTDDRTKDKDARTARQSDEKTGRDYENRIGISKPRQEPGFSSRSDKKNDTNVKNDHHNAENDKRSHLGHQHKTDGNNSGEPRRDNKDIDGGGSREERKRKVEDAGLSDLGSRASRRPATVEDQEGRDRESRDHRSYERSQEDRRREDYPKSYQHEDSYERRGGTKDEQRYDDTKRRRYDDSPRHSTRDRRDRNFGDDSSGGRRR